MTGGHRYQFSHLEYEARHIPKVWLMYSNTISAFLFIKIITYYESSYMSS